MTTAHPHPPQYRPCACGCGALVPLDACRVYRLRRRGQVGVYATRACQGRAFRARLSQAPCACGCGVLVPWNRNSRRRLRDGLPTGYATPRCIATLRTGETPWAAPCGACGSTMLLSYTQRWRWRTLGQRGFTCAACLAARHAGYWRPKTVPCTRCGGALAMDRNRRERWRTGTRQFRHRRACPDSATPAQGLSLMDEWRQALGYTAVPPAEETDDGDE